eukprot:GFUD01114927.1.p1 GENE.GFUD01114927.1~~GFUD01114927.1.p1  ORF type:complete len:453 (-),score=155.24 GFUD01114927.1:150-1508(-)
METQVRRRKASPGGDSDVKATKVTEGGGGPFAQTDFPFTYLVLLVFVVILSCLGVVKLIPDPPVSLVLLSMLDSSLNMLGLCPAVYAVVLDAGSTGSRVLTFSFYKNPLTGKLVMEDELFHEVKPGLSSFASNPQAGADTITSLLSLAQERIPKDMWSKVPVTLKATAGLRLLPAEQSEALISAVQERMDLSGFDNRGVGMLSELDEGVFGWMTVNYLLDQLHHPRKSYVALDLGGGSTQITFLPKYEETFSSSPASFLHPTKVFTTPHTIYSHSYLGLGLMAAREAIFKYNDPEGSTSLVSPCMVTTSPTSWEFHGKVYTISPSTTLPGYEACMLEVQAVIDSLGVDQCAEVPTRKIAAFSYFHDRAVDAGLMSPGQSGVVTVQQFLDSAQTACSQPPASQGSFLCVDLTFIAGLLHHGYRLAADAKLGLYKEINGHQTSWALGAAFNMLE